MPLSHILGQEAAVATIARALRGGRVHHAYRFEGPAGVGKELAAVALAQALVCSTDPLGCGACSACRRAATFADTPPRVPLHPDVILVGRGVYPPDAIGRSRAEISEISVDQIRKVVLVHTSYPPHEARARVFIVRDADELSASAANALLKTLEEPTPRTHFVLLSSRADRLLPTIRSRTLAIRFAPLSDDILRGILDRHGVARERQDLAIELAGGSASAALSEADAEISAARDAFVASMLAALAARDLGPAVALAESRDTSREQAKSDLRALGARFAVSARAEVERAPDAALVAARRYEATLRAIERLEQNAAPALTLIQLAADLRAPSAPAP